MSTWISKAPYLALILGLCACQGLPGASSATGTQRQFAVLAGDLTVAAPQGYCVDRQSVRQESDGAVVLIGRCSAGSSLPPAVISVTIGATATAGAIANGSQALAAYFQTPGGLAALSRTGKADDVQILQTATTDGAFTLHIAVAGSGDYWRAILGISGRLVTVSVQGSGTGSLEPQIGRNLLDATIQAMRKSNHTQ